jgi:hypothetical protein
MPCPIGMRASVERSDPKKMRLEVCGKGLVKGIPDAVAEEFSIGTAFPSMRQGSTLNRVILRPNAGRRIACQTRIYPTRKALGPELHLHIAFEFALYHALDEN